MDFKNALLLVKLSELRHLHDFMFERGIKDRAQVGDDLWVCKHLDKYECFSLLDVRKKYNDLATKLGQIDKLII
jgi:hypothetical protein